MNNNNHNNVMDVQVLIAGGLTWETIISPSQPVSHSLSGG